MPELPEAETIVRGLAEQTLGRVIDRVDLLRPDVIRAGAKQMKSVLAGRRISNVTRRGKRVVVHFQPQGVLVVALGMTGRLMVTSAEADVVKHTHLRLLLDDGEREIRFRDPRRFGGVWFYDGMPSDLEGPLPLGAEPTTISLADFRGLLDRPRQIKALLMDQHVLAGLGNIYCDESLHRAGIHPLTRADRIGPDRVRRLHQVMRRVLSAAIRAGGSTLNDYRNVNGDEGFFQARHRVYGREGQACRTCGTPILRTQVAGRSTHWCPVCQSERQESLRKVTRKRTDRS